MVLGQMVIDAPEQVVSVCKELVKTSISWEDCDNMMEGIEPLIRKEPELYLTMLDSWLQDENKWVRRCALTVIGRLPMKRPDYTAQCLDMVVPCLDDNDQDIKRAASFAIRMGARGDIEAVLTFIRTHATGTSPARIWVFSDVIRSMTKKFLPHFKDMLPVYEAWLHTVDNPRSQKSLQSAIRILKS
jgi:3-methyladenine DNA glycosylase AlkD